MTRKRNNIINNFYVYIYLDPRKPGKYCYEEFEFEYEPFYVGKGRRTRYLDHLKDLDKDNNTIKTGKIKHIMALNTLPVIIKIKDFLFLKEANALEIRLISLIGRLKGQLIVRSGPLSNLTPGGDGGGGWPIQTPEMKERIREKLIGRIISKETRIRQSLIRKNKTYEQIYGKEKAQQLRLAHSKVMMGNNTWSRKGIPSNRKGKTYEQIFGQEKAKGLLEYHRKKMSGKNNPRYGLKGVDNPVFGQKRRPEQIENMKNAQSKRFSEKRKKNNLELEQNLRQNKKNFFLVFFENNEEKAIYKRKSVLNKKFKSSDSIRRIIYVSFKDNDVFETELDLKKFMTKEWFKSNSNKKINC
jgi:hypothetical protein